MNKKTSNKNGLKVLGGGKTVRSGLVVGVVNAHNCCDWIWETIEAGIDITFEEALQVEKEKVRSRLLSENDGVEYDDLESDVEKELEEFSDGYENDYRVMLFGDWVKNAAGKYEINKKTGKQGFAATCSNSNGDIICVEWSKYYARVNKTSPCYIMTDGRACGDLDTPLSKGGVLAYCLPADYFEKENDEKALKSIAKTIDKRNEVEKEMKILEKGEIESWYRIREIGKEK